MVSLVHSSAANERVPQPGKDDTSKNPTTAMEIRAKLVPATELEQCGERLRQGGLVAFPTETVYGLGCNALDPAAIIKVFQAKERPLTDPLITHVTETRVAYDLWAADTSSCSNETTPTNATDTSQLEGRALQTLCQRFWPGPLTLVAKAAPHVPNILMANTGFVACRSPRHPVSVALINAAKVPIAAPSANKFGHVSPTRSHHVWDDLKYEDVWIVKEKNEQQQTFENNSVECCDVGVESSVAKIEMMDDSLEVGTPTSDVMVKGRITLLRQGAVSAQDIRQCLKDAGLDTHFEVLARTKKATDETVAHVAPGQTIRHYSPHIPSFILSRSLYHETLNSPPSLDSDDKACLSTSVLIDFGGKLKKWKPYSLAYRDLSAAGDSAEATKGLFETLRWAERVEGATQILFPEIPSHVEQKNSDGSSPIASDALTLALKDRLTRAASGVVIHSLSKEASEQI